MSEYTWPDYVSNDSMIDRYSSYQDRYVIKPRESDKVLLGMIGESCSAARSINLGVIFER